MHATGMHGWINGKRYRDEVLYSVVCTLFIYLSLHVLVFICCCVVLVFLLFFLGGGGGGGGEVEGGFGGIIVWCMIL